MKLMRNQLNVNFNFSKAELEGNETLSKWMMNFTSGVGYSNKIEFMNEIFPERPLKSNSFSSFNKVQLSSIYLLNDERISHLINKGAVLVGAVGEEINVLSRFFLLQKDYLFDKDLRIGSSEFSNWDALSEYTLPLTDIIVIDPFILKNTEVNIDTIDVNLIKWLNIICNESKSSVNVVIVYNNNKCDYDLNNVRQKISNSLKKTTGIKPRITFIQTFKEHDRTIITNYMRYSGNTFNYWNSIGKQITKGKEFSIKSLARSDYYVKAFEAIHDVQEIIEHLCQKNSKAIIGDKISNFLHFPGKHTTALN